MRRIVAALLCAVSFSAPAQIASVTAQALLPSPVGAVIMVGQWLMRDNKRVYYIRVRGEGASFIEARQNGLRLAVEQALGTLVLSETEVRDQRIVRDEIITYAAGFVDRFEIVDADHVNRTVNRVTMDVWVSESRIAHRLLNESVGTGTIDGARLTTQVDTIQQERVSADRVLSTVLQDFPRRAFDVELSKSRVDFSAQRTLHIDVPYTVSWNRAYLDSFNEALRRVGNDSGSCWWPTPECRQRQHRQYTIYGVAFEDQVQAVNIVKHMAHLAKPAVQFVIMDAHGRSLVQTCQLMLFSNIENQPSNIPNRYFLSVGSNSVSIDRKYSVPGRIQLNFGHNPEILRTAQRIEARIIPEKECIKQ